MSDKERLDEVYSIVTNLHDQGQMTDGLYMKAMLTLASDWAILGDFAEAMMLVAKVSHTYIREDLSAQMDSDPSFGRAAHRLAELLVDAGHASADPVDGELALLLAIAKPARA